MDTNNRKTGEYKKLSVSDLQRHYERCEPAILSYCKEGDTFRALVGNHNHWWDTDREKGTAKLFYPNSEKYKALTRKYRTLYWTTQFFTAETANIEKPYDFKEYEISEQIGGREETFYHSFFLDLDAVKVDKDNKPQDIHTPGMIEWLEKAIKFFADTLLNAGVKSFGLAFSGGGVYCVLHPRLGELGDIDKDDYAYRMEVWQKAFDSFIEDTENAFFRKYPAALGWVKFDKLNFGAKRQVKSLFAIHKKFDYAVIPLDKHNPKIDLKAASLPISDEIIENGKDWLVYQDDSTPFGKLLSTFLDKAKEKITKTHGKRIIEIEKNEVPMSNWAPCIRNILKIQVLSVGGGASRASGVLLSYMRFMGVPEDKALKTFREIAQRWNSPTSNLFERWYKCEGVDEPTCFVGNCAKMREKGGGYPHPTLGDLNVCVPDAICKENKIVDPMRYHSKKKTKRGGVDVADIDLKFGDNDFGTAKIRRGYGGGVLIRVDSDKYAVAERTAPIDFYQRSWHVNNIFTKIKKELGDDFDTFFDKLENVFEEKIGGLPEIETTEEDENNVEYKTKGELEDGRFFEEIMRDGEETFVVYNPENDAYEYIHDLNNGGKLILPRKVSDGEINSLMLPDGIEEYGTLPELRKEMVAFGLTEFDPVDNEDLFELVIYLCLTTWIAPEIMEDLIEKFIPIVSARGASETGKKRFLTVMRWLTYRSMYVLKTVKVPTLFRMVSPWDATLILDEADLSDSNENADFIEFLNSRADGVSIPRYNASTGELDFFKSFGMTVLAERSAAVDDGFESRKIIYPSDATPNPKDYSLIPPEEWCVRGRQLLRKLLLFKFRHMKNAMPNNLIIPNVKSFRVRESLLVLQSLSGEDEEIAQKISEIAQKLEERIILERANSLDGMIINIVYEAVVDEEGFIQLHGDHYEMIRAHKPKNGEEIGYNSLITLKTVSGTMNKVLLPAEVARRWRGLGQGTREQGRFESIRYRGIIQIQNPKMFRKLLPKYVVDIDWELVDENIPDPDKKPKGEEKEGEGE